MIELNWSGQGQIFENKFEKKTFQHVILVYNLAIYKIFSVSLSKHKNF